MNYSDQSLEEKQKSSLASESFKKIIRDKSEIIW